MEVPYRDPWASLAVQNHPLTDHAYAGFFTYSFLNPVLFDQTGPPFPTPLPCLFSLTDFSPAFCPHTPNDLRLPPPSFQELPVSPPCEGDPAIVGAVSTPHCPSFFASPCCHCPGPTLAAAYDPPRVFIRFFPPPDVIPRDKQ